MEGNAFCKMNFFFYVENISTKKNSTITDVFDASKTLTNIDEVDITF